MPPGYLIRDRSQLASALSGLMFPVAMKIQSRDIPHKSEAGGVKVNVRDLDEAAAAFDELIARARTYKPDAKIDGVLAERWRGPASR